MTPTNLEKIIREIKAKMDAGTPLTISDIKKIIGRIVGEMCYSKNPDIIDELTGYIIRHISEDNKTQIEKIINRSSVSPEIKEDLKSTLKPIRNDYYKEISVWLKKKFHKNNGWKEFIDHFGDYIYTMAWDKAIPHNGETREDMTHNLYVSILERLPPKLKKYRGDNKASIATYITICINRIISDIIRSPEMRYIRKVLNQRGMTERQCEIFELYIKPHEAPEIANIFNLTTRQVETELNNIKGKLTPVLLRNLEEYREKNKGWLSTDELTTPNISSKDDPSKSAEISEIISNLKKEFDDKEIFFLQLKYIEEASSEAISELIGVKEDNLKNYTNDIINRLEHSGKNSDYSKDDFIKALKIFEFT